MASASPCPEPNVLRLLVERGSQGPEVEGVAQHLEDCETCGATLESLIASDSTLAGLGHKTIASLEAQSAFQRLKERLRQLRPAAGVARAEFDDATLAHSPPPDADRAGDKTESNLDFLTPPQEPGELGRLGHYQILRLLGSGGMGMVFQAQDLQLQRLVALKVMKPSLAHTPAAKERFLREARACAALVHDHIVTVFQVGEANGVPFMAMEFLEGMPLDARLCEGREVETAEVLRIGREIAKGLAAAHAKGLIHRDIKPANIWLDQNSGRIKILDFGLARGQADNVNLTQSGTIVGTPAYMAPEQARGEKVDHRCDLFSLGCVLYRLAAGRVPFEGNTTLGVLTALAVDTPKSVKDINVKCLAALSDLIDRLLAKKPDDRPLSAQAVVQALEAMERSLVPRAETTIKSMPAPTREVEPRPQPAARRAAPRRWPLVAAAAAMLATVALAGWVIIRDKDGKEVARYPIPEGGSAKVEDQAVAVNPPKVREKPFVLLAADSKKRGEYKSLEEALADQTATDAIEIHGDGPFVVGNVNAKKGLNLRAAPGYRPRIIKSPEPPSNWWFRIQGKAHIEGCDFVSGPVRAMFTGGGPVWEFRNCRLLRDVNTNALITFAGDKLRLQDCLIANLANQSVITLNSPNPAELELVNNVLISTHNALIAASPPSPALRVILERNTFFGAVFRLGSESPLAVSATGNLFFMPANRYRLTVGPVRTPGFTWQGGNNLYPETTICGHIVGDQEIPLDLAGWRKLWGEAEQASQAATVKFQWQVGRQLPAKTGLDTVIAEAVDAVIQNPALPWTKADPVIGDLRSWRTVPPLQDIGADVDRVATAPASPAASPFVLLAADGKERGRYRTLEEALVGQKDADIIEIHGNGPFVVGNVNIKKGLNLRAAPGFRPRIVSSPDTVNHWWITIQGNVRIEGCDFVAGPPVILCFAGQGPSWEFRNCRFLTRGKVLQFGGARLRLQDSLVAGFGGHSIISMLSPDPADLELINNVLIAKNSVFTRGVGRGKSPVLNARLERNTFFTSVSWLFPGSPIAMTATSNVLCYPSALISLPKDASMTWQGRGNLYPNFRVLAQLIDEVQTDIDLAGWKKFAGVDDPDGRTLDVQFAWLARRELGPKLTGADWNRLYSEISQAIDTLTAKPDTPWDQVEPAIGDPRSWRAVPPLQEVGADVDRVATAPTPQPSPADKASPFVLVRDGQPAREFKSLGGALHESKAGDVIEIHANGPLSLAGLEQIDKPLKLRGGAGYRPWLIMPPSIKVVNAALDVEGCDLDARASSRLFEGTGPSWELRRCRIWGGYVTYSGPRLRMTDCLVLSGGHSFLQTHAECAVEIDNCLTNVRGPVVQVSAEATIRLTNSTFALTGFGSGSVVGLHDNAKGASVEAAGNLFICNNSQSDGPLSRLGGLKRIRWQGRDNLYSGTFSIEKKPGEVVQGLTEWNKLLEQPEEGSREAPQLTLEWSRAGNLDWPGTRALYQPQVAASMRRHGLAELGPDWDLIGPGAAYVKALEKAVGQPIPLRPEAPDGRPIVILRGGKVAASFRTLQEAADAVLDGDVVEVRTDERMKGAMFRGKGRPLTLRAAPGYAPVVDNLTSDDRLSLEGIAFAGFVRGSRWGGDPVGFTEGQTGGFQRLANCLLPLECSGVFCGRNGQPPEIVNCWIGGSLLGGAEELPLSVSNNVIRWFRVEARPGKLVTVAVDRCVLANPAPGYYPAYYTIQVVPRQPKAVTLSVRRSFVQSPDALVHIPRGFKWEGAGNVYRVPRVYSHGAGVWTLTDWRALNKSDADSFEEAPSQFDPALWRVRADSPGYVKRADGRDYGADVSRILAPSVSPLDVLRRQDIP